VERAISAWQDGARGTATVSLSFDIDLIPLPRPILYPPEPPKPPFDTDIDVCYLICPRGNESFLQCYVECKSPSPPDPELFRELWCKVLWDRYENAETQFDRFGILLSLVRAGCITLEQLGIQFPDTLPEPT
jgi:hypothetical protein